MNKTALTIITLTLSTSVLSVGNNPYGAGYHQTSNPYGSGYIQDSNPYGSGYVQDKGLFGFFGR